MERQKVCVCIHAHVYAWIWEHKPSHRWPQWSTKITISLACWQLLQIPFVLSVLQDNVRLWHFHFYYTSCIKERLCGVFHSFSTGLWVWILSYCSKMLTETKLLNSFWRDVGKAGNNGTDMQTRLIIYVMLFLLTFIIILIISQLLHFTDLTAGLGDICWIKSIIATI